MKKSAREKVLEHLRQAEATVIIQPFADELSDQLQLERDYIATLEGEIASAKEALRLNGVLQLRRESIAEGIDTLVRLKEGKR